MVAGLHQRGLARLKGAPEAPGGNDNIFCDQRFKSSSVAI